MEPIDKNDSCEGELEEALQSSESEEELLSILGIVLSLDQDVGKGFTVRLLGKLLKTMLVDLELKGKAGVEIISAMKENGDYEDLKGVLLYVLADKCKDVLSRQTYLEVFGRHLEVIGEYYRRKGNKQQLMRNMELLVDVLEGEGQKEKAEEVKQKVQKGNL